MAILKSKDDEPSPPPYTPVPAPGQPSAVGSEQLSPRAQSPMAAQSSQYPTASGPGGQGGPLLPTHTHAQVRVMTEQEIVASGHRARRRFLVAFLWAFAIWLFVGLILGGFGAMDYGRHPHRPNRPNRPNGPDWDRPQALPSPLEWQVMDVPPPSQVANAEVEGMGWDGHVEEPDIVLLDEGSEIAQVELEEWVELEHWEE